jgi:hypothetical protein
MWWQEHRRDAADTMLPIGPPADGEVWFDMSLTAGTGRRPGAALA